jgi:cytosine deaminase
LFDLIIRNATLPDGRSGIDLAVSDGRIAAVEPQAVLAGARAGRELDAGGMLLSPPFVDAHFHLDAALSLGLPRLNASGTLLEGIAIWGELKPDLTQEAIVARALRYCDQAVARGLLAVRSHVDTSDPRLLAVEALLEVKRRVAPYLDLQLVAFPQEGALRYEPRRDDPSCGVSALGLLERALDLGVEVVGGIPHFERTMDEGRESVRLLCEIAARRGLPVDMHCDESDDPMSRHIESLAFQTQRLGLQGRVTGSHLTSMHSMDSDYVAKLIPLIAQSGVSAVANPLINITLQGRCDVYPKRRGMTRVPELLAAGVPVAFGHDCAMDPWYPMGSGDMLGVASMGLHVAQMTGQAAMRSCFDAVTVVPAGILGLEGYGLAPGCHADMVLLQARDPIEAIRLSPPRLAVLRRGRLVAEQPPATARLHLGGRPGTVDFLNPR